MVFYIRCQTILNGFFSFYFHSVLPLDYSDNLYLLFHFFFTVHQPKYLHLNNNRSVDMFLHYLTLKIMKHD